MAAGALLILVAYLDMGAGWNVQTVADALREAAIVSGCVRATVAMRWQADKDQPAVIELRCSERKQADPPAPAPGPGGGDGGP